jgi:hypothetical protein
MSEGSVPRPSVGDWSDALLTSGTEALLGAVRNYIGPIKTPYDKRDLVRRLEAFLRRVETRNSLLALLDVLDIRILGSSLLLGSVPEQALKDLFAGELPLFELGVRISNLLDRLLLFRYQFGGRRLIAVNPLLEEELRPRVLDPAVFFGNRESSEPEAAGGIPATGCAVDAKAAVAFFSFLFHASASTRKGGGLTKRAAERAAALFPELSAGGGDRLGALARALAAAGVLRVVEDEDRCLDRQAFRRLLSAWAEDLPCYLASCLATEGRPEAEAAHPEGGPGEAASSLAIIIASALESLPEDVALSRPTLARWLRIIARRVRFDADPAAALGPLEELGILEPRGGGYVPARSSVVAAARRPGLLVVEGAHALHLMPEASLEERLFVGCLARPVSLGTVWSFDVERDTVRRGFAAGLDATEMKSRLEALSGAALPQSFAFSLSAWEEEYRSLRLYRGFTLVADERLRPVIERAAALGKIAADKLAPGVYLLRAATPDEAMAALSAAGLEAPPLMQARFPREDTAGARPGEGPSLGGAAGEAGSAPRLRIDAVRDLIAAGGLSRAGGSGRTPDPEPRLTALRASLAASGRAEEERRELADRIERRLVLTERQIAQSDPKPERLEAGGLDYLGKVRVVERALRAAGDRLEVLYRLPGEEPVRALLRPVRLDKNEKGLVLEAEDLGTGGPARVPLGAVSTVRRVRASLFGEDQ